MITRKEADMLVYLATGDCRKTLRYRLNLWAVTRAIRKTSKRGGWWVRYSGALLTPAMRKALAISLRSSGFSVRDSYLDFVVSWGEY
jgi:hypothetical protein